MRGEDSETVGLFSSFMTGEGAGGVRAISPLWVPLTALRKSRNRQRKGPLKELELADLRLERQWLFGTKRSDSG